MRHLNRHAAASLLALGLIAGMSAFSGKAVAQFGSIFSNDPPPRPPSDVPNRPPLEVSPPPVQTLPPPSSQPPAGGRGVQGVQSQPLPPPPGAPAVPLDPRPQQTEAPRSPLPGLPAGQRQPRGTPQPANTAPQPGDEVIAEPPSQKIPNSQAIFSGLDKITGRIISFDVAINETVQFGALQVTPRACYTRPPTETQNTDGFIEVDEVTLQGEVRRIFNGWMFASSPGLHAVEHPIYDVWLTDCKQPQVAPAEEPVAAAPANPQPARSTRSPANPTQRSARPVQSSQPPPRLPGGTLLSPQ